MPYQAINLTGQQFGRLLVLTRFGTLNGQAVWTCRCACGSTTTVRSQALRSHRTNSCGCLAKEATRSRTTTHGGSDHPLYATWKTMIARCTNPAHVCDADRGWYTDERPIEQHPRFAGLNLPTQPGLFS